MIGMQSMNRQKETGCMRFFNVLQSISSFNYADYKMYTLNKTSQILIKYSFEIQKVNELTLTTEIYPDSTSHVKTNKWIVILLVE